MKQTIPIRFESSAPFACECRLLPRRAGTDKKPVKRLRSSRRTLSRYPLSTLAWLRISPVPARLNTEHCHEHEELNARHISQADKEGRPSEPFEALIAYEDLVSGPAARAGRDAASADVVVLSLHGDCSLPGAFKELLSAWLAERGKRDGALGVLLNWEKRHTQVTGETLTFLQWATQRHPVDLFAGYLGSASGGDPIPAVEDIRPRAKATSLVREAILHRPNAPHARCEINELESA